MSASGELKTPSHLLRNALVIIGVLAAGGAIWAYGQSSSKKDVARLVRFDAFRAAYAEKCNVPSYAAPVAEVISDVYLTSLPIQTEVDRQLAALKAGASCADVVKKLKSVDLAIPVPGPT